MKSLINLVNRVDPDRFRKGDYWKNLTPKYLKRDIEQGLDVNIQDRHGNTPLFFIVEESNPNIEIIKMLIDHGADVNAMNDEDITVLMHAGRFTNNPAIITLLIDNGAIVDKRGLYGGTALEYAGRFNTNPDIIKTLLEHGADINAKTDNEVIIFSASQINRENPDVDFLIHYIRGRDKLGYSYDDPKLFLNKEYWEIAIPESVKRAIEKGADVNILNEKGQTPLMLASLYTKNPKVIKTLLKHGADTSVEDYRGRTAVDLIYQYDYPFDFTCYNRGILYKKVIIDSILDHTPKPFSEVVKTLILFTCIVAIFGLMALIT